MTRIDKLRERLGPFEAAIVETPLNRAYLTHFTATDGRLVVFPDSACLIIDFRYFEAAKEAAPEGLKVVLQGDLRAQTEELLKKQAPREVLLEDGLTLAACAGIKRSFPDYIFDCTERLSKAVTAVRMIKDEREIALIKAAQKITDAAFEEIINFIKPGISEHALATELEYYMRRRGADGFAFPTIAVSGKNTAKPHGVPTDKLIESGDLVTLDFGAMREDYCSDMTRTVAVGYIDDEKRRVYDTVLKAHLAAMDFARAGVTGVELDYAARSIINAAGYEGRFQHGLGHSLGLEVHEPPRANTVWREKLLPGTLMSIEPGIYFEGRFGVRIESLIVLREGGCENLTASNRELLVL